MPGYAEPDPGVMAHPWTDPQLEIRGLARMVSEVFGSNGVVDPVRSVFDRYIALAPYSGALSRTTLVCSDVDARGLSALRERGILVEMEGTSGLPSGPLYAHDPGRLAGIVNGRGGYDRPDSRDSSVDG